MSVIENTMPKTYDVENRLTVAITSLRSLCHHEPDGNEPQHSVDEIVREFLQTSIRLPFTTLSTHNQRQCSCVTVVLEDVWREDECEEECARHEHGSIREECRPKHMLTAAAVDRDAEYDCCEDLHATIDIFV